MIHGDDFFIPVSLFGVFSPLAKYFSLIPYCSSAA
jgi:hypothetical protein